MYASVAKMLLSAVLGAFFAFIKKKNNKRVGTPIRVASSTALSGALCIVNAPLDPDLDLFLSRHHALEVGQKNSSGPPDIFTHPT